MTLPSRPPQFTVGYLHDSGQKAFVFMSVDDSPPSPTGGRWVAVRVDDPKLGFVLEAEASGHGLRRLSVSASPGDGDGGATLNVRDGALTKLARLVEPWVQLALEYRGHQDSGDHHLLDESAPTPEAAIARARVALAGVTRRSGTRARGEAKKLLLERVAEEYRLALASGHKQPRKIVAARLGYSVEHIGRLLVEARRTVPPLLGPASPGKAGEASPSGEC